MRPTEISKLVFEVSANSARTAMEDNAAPEYIKNLAHSIANMADGLQSLSVALRATYIELENVKKIAAGRTVR
jgi:hypothetical protein